MFCQSTQESAAAKSVAGQRSAQKQPSNTRLALVLFAAVILSTQPVFASDQHRREINSVVERYRVSDNEDGRAVEVVVFENHYTTFEAWLTAQYGFDVTQATHVVAETISTINHPDGGVRTVFVTYELSAYVYNVALVDDREVELLRTSFEPGDEVNELEVRVGAQLPRFTNLSNTDTYSTFVAMAGSSPESHSKASGLPAAFGKQLGSFNGVASYSNISNETGNAAGYNFVGSYQTGLRWHCTEFVARYFYLVFGKKIAGGNADTFYPKAAAKGLASAKNGDTNAPRVGNIIASQGGPYGHVAIIRETRVPRVGETGGYVMVIQQNWGNNTGDTNKKLSLKVTKDSDGKERFTVGGFSATYPIKGWMWPK